MKQSAMVVSKFELNPWETNLGVAQALTYHLQQNMFIYKPLFRVGQRARRRDSRDKRKSNIKTEIKAFFITISSSAIFLNGSSPPPPGTFWEDPNDSNGRYLSEDSLYLRSRVYRILWGKPLRQLITRRDTDVTIDIDWQPNPWSMISRKLGITEDMLIEHGVFSAWQEYKRVFIAQWLSPMDTCTNNITITCCWFVAVTASRSVFSLIENQTFAE